MWRRAFLSTSRRLQAPNTSAALLHPRTRSFTICGRKHSPPPSALPIQELGSGGIDTQLGRLSNAESQQSPQGWWWKHPRVRRAALSHQILAPTSGLELVLLLVQMSLAFPRPPHSDLIRIHNSYPHHQSTHSVNLLLDLVCTSSRPARFQRLLAQATALGFGNEMTVKLHVRHLGSQGKHVEATQLALVQGNGTLTLDLLMELLRAPSSARPTGAYTANTVDLVASSLARADQNLSPSVAKTTIQHLRSVHLYREAFDLTGRYIQHLPSSPSSTQAQIALSLIHENLALPSKTLLKRPLSGQILLQDVLGLLRLHPGVRPTARTLELALEWLRNKDRRGFRAAKMLKDWRARWGDHVEDSTVRRKVAALALSSGYPKLARKLVERELKIRASSAPLRHSGRDPVSRLDMVNGRDGFLWDRLVRRLEKQEELARASTFNQAHKYPSTLANRDASQS